MPVDTKTGKKTPVYVLARFLTWIMFHFLTPVSYHHKEKLSEKKPPFVIISNHVHALDPFIVASPVKQCECAFLAKKELQKNAFVTKILTNLHCIFVDRHHTDMEAMRTCMRTLKNGQCLVIFPEGTRHHEGQMEHIENGTSLIVLRSGVPLVPVYLDSPLRLFHRVNAYIGDPVPTSDLHDKGVNRETCDLLNCRMTETFKRMIAEAEKQGVCGDGSNRKF